MMKSKLEIIGLYPVLTNTNVHLIEINIRDSQSAIDWTKFTQSNLFQPVSNWQVPWDEKILNQDGTEVIADSYEISRNPELCKGDVRIVFFLHSINFLTLLITPYGNMKLPKVTELPERLKFIEYIEPD